MKSLVLSFLILMMSPVASFGDGDIVLSDDRHESILVQRLEGNWVINEELTDFLAAGNSRDTGITGFSFFPDETVVHEINMRRNGRRLEYDAAFGAGYIRVAPEQNWEYDRYVLIRRDENLWLAIFNENERDGNGDWEFLSVSLAPGIDGNDILFLGGDHEGERVLAFVRAVE